MGCIDDFRAWMRGDTLAIQDTASKAAGGVLSGDAAMALVGDGVNRQSVMRANSTPVEMPTGNAIKFGIAGAVNTNAAVVAPGTAASDGGTITFTGGSMGFATVQSAEYEVSRPLLQDAGADIEGEVLRPAIDDMALQLDNLYTNSATGEIEGLTAGDIPALGATGTTQEIAALAISEVGNPYAIGRNLLEALPRQYRASAQFMGNFATQSALYDALAQAWHRFAAGTGPGDRTFIDRPFIENDSIASTIKYGDDRKAATVSPSEGKPLWVGDFRRLYKIRDAAPGFEIVRLESGGYERRNTVGFVIRLRTAGKLVAPARSILFAQ